MQSNTKHKTAKQSWRINTKLIKAKQGNEKQHTAKRNEAKQSEAKQTKQRKAKQSQDRNRNQVREAKEPARGPFSEALLDELDNNLHV